MLKKLMEEKGKLISEIRRLSDLVNNENRDFTSEEEAAWEKANKDYDALNKRINVAERAESLELDLGNDPEEELRSLGATFGDDEQKLKDTPETRNLSTEAWLRSQKGKVSSEMREAAKFHGINYVSPELHLELRSDYEEVRAMSAVKGATGGFTVKPVFVDNLEVALLDFGGMRSVAEVIRTDTGAEMSWPTFDDTSNEGSFVGENVDHSTATDPDFEQIRWNAYECTSGVLKVPESVLQDSSLNLNQLIPAALGTRIARRTNRAYTTGTGASLPQGITVKAAAGVTAAAAAAVTTDELLELIYSVDRAYRMNGRFMMEDDSILKIRKLKDGNGQYLWTPGTMVGEQDKLFTYPIVVNEDMAAMTTGNISVLFGDFSKYKIRDVRQLYVKRLVERYAEYNQVGFLAILRTDGNLLDAGTNPVKKLTQA